MLFITGYHGSGKSTAARYLHEQHDYLHIERSTILNQAKDDTENGNMPMREWRALQIRLLGKFVLEDIISRSIRSQYTHATQKDRQPHGVVITGNRSLDEIYYMATNLADIDNREPTIVAIRSDEDLLFERYIRRARFKCDENMTTDTFMRMLQRERDAGIEEIFDHATHVITNNGPTTNLSRLLDGIVATQGDHT